MNTYSAYKDSGEQWLGQIPEHWEMKRLAACFAKRSENWKRGETLELLSLLKDVGIVPYSEKGNIGNTAKTNFSQYKVARKGDLVINSMNVIIGSLGITPMDGYISPAYYAFAPREGVNTRYYNYILSLRRAQQNIRRFSKGIMEIRLKISANDFLSIQYPVPPKEEQEAMVAYLDEQTAQIDSAIAREQKMIDLLNERKQIIIQQAVTKGLNPNAPLKDSGIDWIGEIPEGWEVRKLKYIARLQSGDTINSDRFTEFGYPVYGGNGFRGYTDKYTNDGDYVLIGRQGALCGNVNYASGKFFASEHAVVVYPKSKDENLIWLGNVIKVSNLNQYSQSAAQPGLAVSVIQNIAYPFPPQEERKIIGDYLIEAISTIDKAIEPIERLIALLQERKQIIINEVVTGKIKVS